MTHLPARVLVSLLVALALFIAACGGDDGGEAAPRSTTDSAAETDGNNDDDRNADGRSSDDRRESSTDNDSLVSEQAGLDLPRTTVFAGVELELTGAHWSNATPPTYARAEPIAGPDVLLFLDLTTRFLPGYPGDDGFMPVRHFVIETASGERRAATGVDYLVEVPIRTSAESKVVLAFEITEDEVEGAVLTYDDATRVPAHIPLTGSVEPSPYPMRVEVNEVAVPHLATGCEPVPTEVQLIAVEWDVDGGVAEDGTKLARGQSSRVLVDHRWLRAELEVTAGAGQCGGTFANQETFRLLVDGAGQAPFNTYSLTLDDGQVAPMTFLFQVPLDATEVALDAGARNATTVTFPIDVPKLP